MKKKFIRIFIIIIAVLLMAGGVIFLYERSKVARMSGDDGQMV